MDDPITKNIIKTLKYETHKIFGNENFNFIMSDIELAECMKSESSFLLESQAASANVVIPSLDLTVSSSLCCSHCMTTFADQVEQRNHYKLDWHRHNLKQSLRGLKYHTEEEFVKLADDLSSISGSESDGSDNDSFPYNKQLTTGISLSSQKQVAAFRHPKIFFVNKDSKIISLYRCVLYGKEDIPNTEQLLDLAKQSPLRSKWAIFMIGGGHFAAAIYEGNTVLLHKTFHSYTVRAKQGGSQSSRDSHSGTSHPRSAGASLRRYNEMAFQQHIQDVLEAWSNELNKCHIIFLRAVSHNRGLLFAGKSSPLQKSDKRIRNIPFPTRRATFSEVQRVHSLLSCIELYGSSEDFILSFPVTTRDTAEFIPKASSPSKTSTPSSPKRETSQRSRKKIDRGKSRISPHRPLPEIVEALATVASSSDDDSASYELVEILQDINLADDLQEFDDDVPREEKKRHKKTKKLKAKSKIGNTENTAKSVETSEEPFVLGPDAASWSTSLMSVCHDTEQLRLILREKESLKISSFEIAVILNQPIDTRHNTMLHLAASQGLPDRVRVLLEAGVDPTWKNADKKTPYKVAKNWETKKAFRRFQADFPDKYNYKKAEIPGGLTEEEERTEEAAYMERKKAQKRAKKDRLAEKKKAETEQRELEETQRKEKEERDRFLNLSDREKRALAAERRVLASGGQVTVRCFLCGYNMTGQVPFSYQNYIFCSMLCLKGHRLHKTKPL